jgi:hypothetical protein
MGVFYDESDDTPAMIGNIIGSIFGIIIYIGVAWLMVYPFLR